MASSPRHFSLHPPFLSKYTLLPPIKQDPEYSPVCDYCSVHAGLIGWHRDCSFYHGHLKPVGIWLHCLKIDKCQKNTLQE